MASSLQETYAPGNACFGCGPSNALGLRIRSIPSKDPDLVEADWQPAKQHEAFEGVLSGGIIGTLLDCHSNWTAAWHLMRKAGATHPPCTVTAEFHVKLTRPTPSDEAVHLEARVTESTADRAVVEATLTAKGKITATCRGVFVAVTEGHPAYHRW